MIVALPQIYMNWVLGLYSFALINELPYLSETKSQIYMKPENGGREGKISLITQYG
jgi:hypothetical protein